MSVISRLSVEDAQKIAAGEVVERPFNIVKELVENAIDAGASVLSVTLENGGKSTIIVGDNGRGMSKDDLLLCTARHATSKIQVFEDIFSVQTFGFRGEALASVRSVGTLTITSRTQEMDHGVQLCCVAGTTVEEVRSIAAPIGTTVKVENIFDLIPVRKKFLKQKETELRHIVQFLHAVALVYPHLHIQCTNDGRSVLSYHAVHDRAGRFEQLWEITDTRSFSVHNASLQVILAGTLMRTGTFRYDRNGVYLFVNNRWVKNYKLTQAIVKAFGPLVSQGRYPYIAVLLTIPPDLVDVNIHPRKEEVLLAQQRPIERFIEQELRKVVEAGATGSTEMVTERLENFGDPLADYRGNKIPPYSAGNVFTPFDFTQLRPMISPVQPNQNQEMASNVGQQSMHKQLFDHQLFGQQVVDQPTSFVPSRLIDQDGYEYKADKTDNQHWGAGKIIGQYSETYILVEQEDGLFFIDQHAAHERILYERYTKSFLNQEHCEHYSLLIPIHYTLSSTEELEMLFRSSEALRMIGMTVEQMGPRTVALCTLPPLLRDHFTIDQLFTIVLNSLVQEQYGAEQHAKVFYEKILIQFACKAAVKAGDKLTHDEMQRLCDELCKTPYAFTCPHGRPTGFLLPRRDIDKKVKRV